MDYLELLNKNKINYIKSNLFINAKYKSSLLENKILALSLATLQETQTEDYVKIESQIDTKLIIELLNGNSGSFYVKLKEAVKSMRRREIGIEIPEEEFFSYSNIIINSDYKNGVLTVEFNPRLKKYLTNIKQNFTKLELRTMLQFQKMCSFRLYELLKSKAYSYDNKNDFQISIDLAELKFVIGVVDIEDKNAYDILNKSTAPDYDKAYESMQDAKYCDWKNFKRKILEPSIQEIETLTNMRIEYETIKKGRGGAVCGIRFHVTILEEKENNKELSPEEFNDVLVQILGENITYFQMKKIRDLCGGNIDIVKQMYQTVPQDDTEKIAQYIIDRLEGNNTDVITPDSLLELIK